MGTVCVVGALVSFLCAGAVSKEDDRVGPAAVLIVIGFALIGLGLIVR